MRVVYHCFGGAHSSPVAAAIHLHKLRRDSVPSSEELMNLPYFDKVTVMDRGKLMFVGNDARGNQVYVLGTGQETEGIPRAILSGAALAGLTAAEFKLANTLPCVNWFMRLGGYVSRQLHLIWLGRPVVLLGTRMAFHLLVKVVEDVERELSLPAGGEVA